MKLVSGLARTSPLRAGWPAPEWMPDWEVVREDVFRKAFGESSFEPGDLLTDYGRVLSAAMCRDALRGGGRQTW